MHRPATIGAILLPPRSTLQGALEEFTRREPRGEMCIVVQVSSGGQGGRLIKLGRAWRSSTMTMPVCGCTSLNAGFHLLRRAVTPWRAG